MQPRETVTGGQGSAQLLKHTVCARSHVRVGGVDTGYAASHRVLEPPGIGSAKLACVIDAQLVVTYERATLEHARATDIVLCVDEHRQVRRLEDVEHRQGSIAPGRSVSQAG